MVNEIINKLLKRISELEKKIETYYKLLKVDNELGFILNGTYILSEQIDKVLNGEY